MILFERLERRFLLILLLMSMMGCGNDVIMKDTSQFISPDGKWIATLEYFDNGMGFGMGADYYEIHLVKPVEKIRRHGEESPSSIFYIESAYQNGDRPHVAWTGPRKLQVVYADISLSGRDKKPGRAMMTFSDVSVEYQTFPLQAPR